MKRLALLITIMFFIFACLYSTSFAKDEAVAIKGQDITMTGKLTCSFCSFSHPDKPCTKGCCSECMKAGDPPLLTDEKGNQYLLLTSEVKTPLMNKERMDMAGGQVTIKGVLVKGKGIQVIFVEKMSKAGK